MPLKITGGLLKGQKIQTIKGDATRPTTEIMRQAVFNKVQHQVVDSAFLDLFAGSGCMGIEALSRGARFCAFVEIGKKQASLIKKSLKDLELEDQASVFAMDAAKAVDFLIKKDFSFDLIYIDPPYGTDELAKRSTSTVIRILKAIDASNLLNKGGKLLLEFTKDFPKEKATLEHLKWLSSKQYGRSTLYTLSKSD